MKNKEVAKILMENPEGEFIVSVDPQFDDEGVRIFAQKVIEIFHQDKETIVCMDGSLN
jgi:hypothetical protein